MARFNRGMPWRFVVTDLDSASVTSLERVGMSRTVTYKLNAPAIATSQVPSDDRRVNLLHDEAGLDAPLVSFNDRLVYGFRREGWDGTHPPWVCRFAGILAQIEDTAQTDQPYSNFTAYDPWQYLYHRAVKNGTSPVGVDGFSYGDTRGDVIVQQLIENTIAVDGPAFIELGTLEETTQIDINFQQGSSVGDALRQLVATGSLDIEFEPVYGRPGICCLVNVYAQKGDERDEAIFAWDVGRSVQSISSLVDGDQMANVIQFYNGQGGPPVTPQIDTASQTRYGVYEAQQFFPGQTVEAAVVAMADLQLQLRKQGRRTVTISPNPLISPIPLVDYTLGDRVPVYATNRLRQTIPWTSAPVYQRVYGIPISLGDDGVETVQRLLASPDGFS